MWYNPDIRYRCIVLLYYCCTIAGAGQGEAREHRQAARHRGGAGGTGQGIKDLSFGRLSSCDHCVILPRLGLVHLLIL